MHPLDIHSDILKARHVTQLKNITLLYIITVVVLDHHKHSLKDLNHVHTIPNLIQHVFQRHPLQRLQ